MYLEREKRFYSYNGKLKVKVIEEVERNEKPRLPQEGVEIDGGQAVGIVTEAAYWRKANHIHKWFIDNCAGGEDDCTRIDVDGEDLENLLEVCKKVKASSKLKEQWVEDGLTRLLSNLHTRGTRQLIRFALDEIIKGVLDIELRLPCLVDDGTSGLLHHLASSRLLSTIAWDVNRATSHHDAVLQLHLCTKYLSQYAREDVQIIIFDIINHKLALHLQYQQVVVPLLCNNRSEPCLVRTLREIITQNLLAFRPQYVQIICH